MIADPAGYAELRRALAGTGIDTAAGPEAVVEAAALPADWTMAAITGAAGLAATLAAISRGAVVALANKEALYNFLSTFSGTHFVTPRAFSAQVGLVF